MYRYMLLFIFISITIYIYVAETMSTIGTDKPQITTDPGKQKLSPIWSPDGQRIAFQLE